MRARKAGAATALAVREQVRERYGTIASGGGCCGGSGCGPSCCGGPAASRELGYSARELQQLPSGADLGLGCGHPTALASLHAGEVVLDLGSGAGIDCFLASKKVGARGHVIGVDMTPEMIAKARSNAVSGRYRNVEFRLGEIAHLPVADASVDVVISNCVINLAPEKEPVYREAFRVLRPGGRLAVSDVVASRPISARERADPSLWPSCASGALGATSVAALLRRAGFRDVQVEPAPCAGTTPRSLAGPATLGVVSADIRGRKPSAGSR